MVLIPIFNLGNGYWSSAMLKYRTLVNNVRSNDALLAGGGVIPLGNHT